MGRSVYTLPYNGDAERARNIAEAFLSEQKFKLVDYNGGKAYKLGVGMAQAMQFVNVEYLQNEIRIEGWICPGLGSATIAEMDLKGFVGCIPKKKLEKRIKALMAKLGAEV